MTWGDVIGIIVFAPGILVILWLVAYVLIWTLRPGMIFEVVEWRRGGGW